MRTFWLFVSALVLVGVLVQPTLAADPPTKEEMLTAQNNLKKIALAAITYADKHNGMMATNIKGKDAKVNLSWRVAILPYMDEEDLYKQFKLDESWDSENNKKLIGKMPKTYAPVRVKAKEGETFYQTFYGPGALFALKLTPKYPASITDGTSQTALVVEGGGALIWSMPGDIPFGKKKPLLKLGGLFDGDFNVALCDGSVITIKKDFDEQQMKHLITPADGDIVDFDKLKK